MHPQSVALLTSDVNNCKSEYEEEGFRLDNNILMLTAENTYQTVLQILYNCIGKLQVISGGGGCALPVPSP